MLWGPAPLNICSSDLPNYGDCCFSRFSLKPQQSCPSRTHRKCNVYLKYGKMKNFYFVIAAMTRYLSISASQVLCHSISCNRVVVVFSILGGDV